MYVCPISKSVGIPARATPSAVALLLHFPAQHFILSSHLTYLKLSSNGDSSILGHFRVSELKFSRVPTFIYATVISSLLQLQRRS